MNEQTTQMQFLEHFHESEQSSVYLPHKHTHIHIVILIIIKMLAPAVFQQNQRSHTIT